jgi:thiamine transport system substrate-binding protein
MKNFVIFLVFIFAGLFAAILYKKNHDSSKDSRPVVRVFGSSSFVSQWGPGPLLKENFEKTCECRVEYLDSADSTIMMQRLKSEGRTSGADVVLGLDQFDIELANQGQEWRKINTDEYDFEEEVKPSLVQSHLVPYDWSLLSFVVRKSDFKELPKKLDDLMAPEYKGQIVMEDPRTSSPGQQFLLWLIQLKGEEKAFQFLTQFNQQLHSYAPSWSTAYGLFQKAQAKVVWSYVTSPVYHIVEDKSTDVVAVDLQEGHPAQFEFAGIPSTCKNCELAEKFMALMLSKEGQKIIMEKNYMFPVIKGVKEGTLFAAIPQYKVTLQDVIPNISDRERILKKWAARRRGE